MRQALEYLDAHLDENVTLDSLAREVGMSPGHLQRTFQALVGVSPRAWQRARRMERLRARLDEGATITTAMFEAGFNSSRSLYESASTRLGMTPGDYRRGGQGLEIRYTTVSSSLGRVLVAATDRGVCSVSLGSEDGALEDALRRQFPRATISRDNGSLDAWVDIIVQYLDGRQAGLAIPLDLHGTAFQVRVWEALRQVPFGETRSYSEIAAAIGEPTAVRAVAGAIANNKAALLVPCHRIVHRDGSLSGYRWGVEVKRRLLALERAGRGECPQGTQGSDEGAPD